MNSSDDYTRAAIQALTRAAENERDFGGWLSHVLATANSRIEDGIIGREGSWETEAVDQLIGGGRAIPGWDKP
ncbi:MAG TPA: hypothetical protein VGD91_23600 [Trebonia sp.]